MRNIPYMGHHTGSYCCHFSLLLLHTISILELGVPLCALTTSHVRPVQEASGLPQAVFPLSPGPTSLTWRSGMKPRASSARLKVLGFRVSVWGLGSRVLGNHK